MQTNFRRFTYLQIKKLFCSKADPPLFIRNINILVCINCMNFIKDTNNYPYDPPPSDTKYGKCKVFGQKNFITGEIEYDYAYNCRTNDKQCGQNGKNYTKNNNINN